MSPGSWQRGPGSGTSGGTAYWWRVAPWVLLVGLLYVILACAWQCDDAYITFRTVANAWSGHGLTWNVDERVQTYTHPLWMLVAWGLYGLSGELYFSTLAFSVLCAAAAAVLAVAPARRSPGRAVLGLLLLSTSAAFVDYATSGLENALLFLLLVLLVRETRARLAVGPLFRATCLVSLVGLTRTDALLIAVPLLAYRWARVRPRGRAALVVAAGLLSLVAWEVFALVYYGTLIPNTALAKLNLEIPLAQLVAQGLRYFADSLRRDPVTLGTILASMGVALWKGSVGQRLVAIGIGLYLLYLARIGGDFMRGRLLAAPFVASVAMSLAVSAPDAPTGGRNRSRRSLVLFMALACAYGVLWPGMRWRSGAHFGAGLSFDDIVLANGIADERAYYYPSTGLLPMLAHGKEIRESGLPFPPYEGCMRGRRFAESSERLAVWDEMGFFGYFAGPQKTVVDEWALCDPLLARIPFRPVGAWRIGHYPRPIPAGYLEGRRTGSNQLQDPDLARAYAAITRVTRGPLFAPERWREIWRLETGYYEAAFRKAAEPPSR